MVKLIHISSRDYQNMLLQKGKKLFSSDSSKFYQVGLNSILKDYQYANLPVSDQFIIPLLENWKKILIEQSKLTDFDELVKAEEIYLVNGLLRGITMPLLPRDAVDFEDYINSLGNNMRTICSQFAALNDLFEQGSKLNLVFLDTVTKGNLKIRPNSTSLLLCDGEGIQINKVFPFIATDFLNLDANEELMKKYFEKCDRGIYASTNLNRLAILAYFIKLCTRYVWITEAYPQFTPSQGMEVILNAIGLIDDDILAPILRTIYEEREIPEIESSRWDDFGQAYKLVPTGYGKEQSGGYAFKRR